MGNIDAGVLGDGVGGGIAKYNLKMIASALNNDYPITPEIRRLIVNQAALIASTAKSKRTRLAAAKVLIAADRCNIQREANHIEDRHVDILEATAIIRTAMQVDGVREKLAQISDSVCEAPFKSESKADSNGSHINGTNGKA